MSARYTVGTVTGWPITEIALRGGRQRSKPSSMSYVYDSAYCYRPIAAFNSRARYGEGRSALEEAERVAAELNREEDAWRARL